VKEVLSKVRAFIRRNRMLHGSNRAVVAVSGGPDSVALLDLLVRLNTAAARRQAAGPSSTSLELHVAHLDHRLRGSESAEDARFVEALTKRYGLKASIGSADIRAEAAAARLGIEEVAREHRYNFLLAVARKIDADLILTGHTMDDQAETFLMRLARGSGLAGLAAMRPVTPALEFPYATGTSDGEGLPRLARPLLCLTRAEVEQYCRENGLEFRIDATNLDPGYARNRIRRQVLPALGMLNPRIVEAIARAADAIAAAKDALDSMARRELKAARIRPSAPCKTPSRAYSVKMLAGQPPGMARRMLIAAIEEQRARPDREADSGQSGFRRKASLQITAAHVAAVESLLRGPSGKRVLLPGGLSAWRQSEALVFKSEDVNPRYELQIDDDCNVAHAGGFELSLLRGQAGSATEAIRQARIDSNERGRDWMIAILDDGLLPDRLIVRPRRAGEKALVLGQNQIKKLKNLMIDHKIPVSRRQNWPTVVTPDDTYVWSPGLPPSVQFAAHKETCRFSVLQALEC
jgi:tRNA(Ile)-lysidine synthetase-like protein